MTRTLLCFATCLILLLPAGAQEENSATQQMLDILQSRQKEAADQLRKRMESMQKLIEDLRRRNENAKADLLQRAIQLIEGKNIKLSDRVGEEDQLADLRTVLREMARILSDTPDAIDDVQRLGEKAVKVLDRIVNTLIDQGDADSLEEREAALRDIRDLTRKLADRQAALKRQTQQAMPRTEAEKAAKAASKELDRLQQQLRDLDRDAREQLAELEQAREWAAALNEMVRRQQRLRDETKVRSGDADTITPQVNDALAKLDALIRSAERAASAEDKKATTAELAREVADLHKRQKDLAREIAFRGALERVAKDLRAGAPDRERLRHAAKFATGDLKKALEDAVARQSDNAKATDSVNKAAKAVAEALRKSPGKDTLKRDQRVMERDIERALEKTPDDAKKATKALNDARRQSGKAATQLEKGTDAEAAATKASEALDKAKTALKTAAAKAGDTAKAKANEADRRAAAKKAAKLADALDTLSKARDTQNAGVSGLVDQAKEAAKRAAEEMQRAADAGARGDAQRAREEANAAKERLERARNELRKGMEERHDLTQRQGKVAKDLAGMANNAKGSSQRAKAAPQLEQAGKMAGGAQASLRKNEFDKAVEQQKQVLDKLKDLKLRADAAVAQKAGEKQKALQNMQAKTQNAADKAGEISRNLKNAARNANENDARRRLKSAQEQTKKAEEALRRSLKRLHDAMPKSAEQDRHEAEDEIKAAQRNLKGLREAHRNPGKNARSQMKQISQQQKQLEDQVKLLEERLKRLKEKSGAQRLQDAQSAMRQAQQRLDQGEADEAERAQDRAEKSLKEAEKELAKEERRYRNLRQYELLFKLKEELKAFRRAAEASREKLVTIEAKVRAAGRVTRSINRNHVQKLRKHVDRLERDVTDKSAAIEKERAIVYTYILKGCASDLKEVEAQLSMKEVGLVPQEMLGDVVRRFDMAIKGLERNLREREADKKKEEQGQPNDQQGNQPSANNGRPVLVPADAEVRMVMVLQKALNQERENFFGSRPDFGSRKPSASEKARLERLYHQQGSLAELFDSLRQALIGQPEEPTPEESPDDGGDE